MPHNAPQFPFMIPHFVVSVKAFSPFCRDFKVKTGPPDAFLRANAVLGKPCPVLTQQEDVPGEELPTFYKLAIMT